MSNPKPTTPEPVKGDPTTGYQNDAQRVYGHRAFELTEEASDEKSTDAANSAAKDVSVDPKPVA